MGIPYRNLGASDPSTTAQHAATVQDNIYCERGCHFKEASVMADMEQAWCDTHRRYCRISTEKADCSVVGLACTPYTHQRANHHDVSPEEHADFAMMFDWLRYVKVRRPAGGIIEQVPAFANPISLDRAPEWLTSMPKSWCDYCRKELIKLGYAVDGCKSDNLTFSNVPKLRTAIEVVKSYSY